MLGDGFRLSLVAAHDDGRPGSASSTCSSPAGPIAASSSNAWCPRMIRRCVRWRICRLRPAGSSAKWRTCTGFGSVGHPEVAPTGASRPLARGRGIPMRSNAGPAPEFAAAGHFPFVTVEGPGVYEIPVGPVHAGLIEPGHFRFSVAGETVLRLKARLWFVHRGIEKLFEGRPPRRGRPGRTRQRRHLRRARARAQPRRSRTRSGSNCPRRCIGCGRCSSSSNGSTTTPPTSVRSPTTSGFGLANAHAQRIREQLLRLNAAVTGHRLLRGAIRPGAGHAAGAARSRPCCGRVAADLAEVAELTLRNSVVHDRFAGTRRPASRRRSRPRLPRLCRARQRHAHRRPTRAPHHRTARHRDRRRAAVTCWPATRCGATNSRRPPSWPAI